MDRMDAPDRTASRSPRLRVSAPPPSLRLRRAGPRPRASSFRVLKSTSPRPASPPSLPLRRACPRLFFPRRPGIRLAAFEQAAEAQGVITKARSHAVHRLSDFALLHGPFIDKQGGRHLARTHQAVCGKTHQAHALPLKIDAGAEHLAGGPIQRLSHIHRGFKCARTRETAQISQTDFQRHAQTV